MKPVARPQLRIPKKPSSISGTRLRNQFGSMVSDHMPDDPHGGSHLTPEQIARAQQVAADLVERYAPKESSGRGGLAAIQRASGGVIKQQTLTALLRNGQCGYQFATNLERFAGLPQGYILHGTVGTKPATTYAARPMKFREKGVWLDTLSDRLPGEFLDFTAGRDPEDPTAASWTPARWLKHVSDELDLWNSLEARRNKR